MSITTVDSCLDWLAQHDLRQKALVAELRQRAADLERELVTVKRTAHDAVAAYTVKVQGRMRDRAAATVDADERADFDFQRATVEQFAAGCLAALEKALGAEAAKPQPHPKFGGTNVPVETQQAICRRYAAGETARRVAEVTGYGVETILKVLRLNGVNVRKTGKPRPGPEQCKAIATAYIDSGRSAAKVARDFGIAHTTVYAILKEMGVATRGRGRRKGSGHQGVATPAA